MRTVLPTEGVDLVVDQSKGLEKLKIGTLLGGFSTEWLAKS